MSELEQLPCALRAFLGEFYDLFHKHVNSFTIQCDHVTREETRKFLWAKLDEYRGITRPEEGKENK